MTKSRNILLLLFKLKSLKGIIDVISPKMSYHYRTTTTFGRLDHGIRNCLVKLVLNDCCSQGDGRLHLCRADASAQLVPSAHPRFCLFG